MKSQACVGKLPKEKMADLRIDTSSQSVVSIIAFLGVRPDC
jgi:hypothetical protein